MIAFRDRRGRTWARRLDVAAAVRMRDLAELDVMAVAADSAIAERLAGPSAEASSEIADAFFALFLPDADRFGYSPRQFGKRLRSVTPAELRRLFFSGISAFFHLPGPTPTGGESREITAVDLWGDIYRLAGEVGVDPDPKTYGELAALADARRKLAWGQTATLQATVLNAAPFRKGSTVHAADLDPTGGLKASGQRAKQEVEITAGEIGLLGRLLTGGRRRGQ